MLSDQGKYEQAEEMCRQALGLRETVLGKDHPFTLTSMNNLATVLRDQGKYEQTEKIHRQALGLQKTVRFDFSWCKILGKDYLVSYTKRISIAIQ